MRYLVWVAQGEVQLHIRRVLYLQMVVKVSSNGACSIVGWLSLYQRSRV